MKGFVLNIFLTLSFIALFGCSTASKVSSSTRQQTHTESASDSVSRISKRDSSLHEQIKEVDSLLRILYKERETARRDCTIIYVHDDGSKDTHQWTHTAEKEVVHDTLWRTRWRDSVRVEVINNTDSVSILQLKYEADSLSDVIIEKETIIKQMSFLDRVRQYIFAGISCFFVIGFVWLYFKFVK